ncbi:MAG: cytochrome c nitrite reductase small subunit [Bdellovibrionaceae bacterium]|nr:cytochrome c nitrite reductase small subunit [Pseudobdellovibrionaceae bacterium]
MRSINYFLVLLGISIGIPLGTGVGTFFYADGLSYLSNNPRACMNCHVMKSQFDSWQASSHHTVAKCNDCHTQGNTLTKYSQKAVNGFLHSFAFTTGYYHDPIFIKGFNQKTAQRSCLGCHAQMVEASHFNIETFKQKSCTDCHREVGHRKW